MKINEYGVESWRAAVLIAAAEQYREPLNTAERTDLLREHFSEMGMEKIVELEAGAIELLRAIAVLVRPFVSGLEVRV